jgi:hypothetical protein
MKYYFDIFLIKKYFILQYYTNIYIYMVASLAIVLCICYES